jgi:hypothetical protein
MKTIGILLGILFLPILAFTFKPNTNYQPTDIVSGIEKTEATTTKTEITTDSEKDTLVQKSVVPATVTVSASDNSAQTITELQEQNSLLRQQIQLQQNQQAQSMEPAPVPIIESPKDKVAPVVSLRGAVRANEPVSGIIAINALIYDPSPENNTF